MCVSSDLCQYTRRHWCRKASEKQQNVSLREYLAPCYTSDSVSAVVEVRPNKSTHANKAPVVWIQCTSTYDSYKTRTGCLVTLSPESFVATWFAFTRKGGCFKNIYPHHRFFVSLLTCARAHICPRFHTWTYTLENDSEAVFRFTLHAKRKHKAVL